jgi:hypothetical protein
MKDALFYAWPVLAIILAVWLRHRPVLRAFPILLVVAWAMFIGGFVFPFVADKAIHCCAPDGQGTQGFDDYLAGAYKMSEYLTRSIYFLLGVVLVLAATLILDGFRKRAAPHRKREVNQPPSGMDAE